MSLNRAAVRFAKQINTTLPNSASPEVLAYGLEVTFLWIIGFLAVSLGGYLVGALPETLAALAAASALRLPGGGVHLNTPAKCVTFTIVVFCLLGFVSLRLAENQVITANIIYVVLGGGIIALIASLLFAPSNPSKPIASAELRRKLRLAAVVISIVVPIILVLIPPGWSSLALAGAAGMVWQGVNMLLAGVIQLRR